MTQKSDVYTTYYAQAVAGCKIKKDPKLCQNLANLCVLKLYNESTLECKAFRAIMDDRELADGGTDGYYGPLGWYNELPWLYYDETPQKVLSEGKPIDLTVSFYADSSDTSRTERLNYWLARYSFEGDFLGWQQLSAQLSPCPFTHSQDILSAQNFGVVSKLNCDFELQKLKSDLSDQLPLESNIFYELFVEDRNKNLVDVPVLIKNFRDVDLK